MDKIAYLVMAVATAGMLVGVAAGSSYAPSQSTQLSFPQSNVFTINLVVKDSYFNSTLGMQPAFYVLQNGTMRSSSVIRLPVGEIIRINIVSYDSMVSPPFATSYSQVTGTLGNQAILLKDNSTLASPSALSRGETVTSVPYADISHTFTIGLPESTVNIPVEIGYNVTAFFEIGQAGVYSWGCMCPCGAGPMETPGWMMGSIEAY
ncbi:MAG: hypothetical protein M1138_07255 [Candidatus Thermoplasmatota archaeon]|jgi:heme/copper-type cytochrome/quinol oxidase subunit 2|nr:hypothetical protein [Candidatus Thermoplasmatota archaeon]